MKYLRKSTQEVHDGKGHVFGHRCERCSGTGQFITMSLNGKPTGPGGICFRCEGKGYQTEADKRRNWGYDNHAAAAAMRADMASAEARRDDDDDDGYVTFAERDAAARDEEEAAEERARREFDHADASSPYDRYGRSKYGRGY